MCNISAPLSYFLRAAYKKERRKKRTKKEVKKGEKLNTRKKRVRKCT
jgi:hypothetical protein